jgi:hypothetical protein
MTGHRIKLGAGWRINHKTGQPERVPRDASAAKRQRAGGSKRVRVVRSTAPR